MKEEKNRNEKLKGMIVRNGIKQLASHVVGLFNDSDIQDVLDITDLEESDKVN